MIMKFQRFETVISLILFTRPQQIATSLERCQSTSVSTRRWGLVSVSLMSQSLEKCVFMTSSGFEQGKFDLVDSGRVGRNGFMYPGRENKTQNQATLHVTCYRN